MLSVTELLPDHPFLEISWSFSKHSGKTLNQTTKCFIHTPLVPLYITIPPIIILSSITAVYTATSKLFNSYLKQFLECRLPLFITKYCEPITWHTSRFSGYALLCFYRLSSAVGIFTRTELYGQIADMHSAFQLLSYVPRSSSHNMTCTFSVHH